MADNDDKEKAEKLAAAKKRYEQLKKQKKGKEEGKSDKTDAPKKKKKDKEKDKTAEKAAAEEANEDRAVDDGEQEAEASKDSDVKEQSEGTQRAEEEVEEDKAVEGSARKDRADSSAKSSDLKSPPLPTHGEEGDAVQDIYKRQKERIRALEEENKKLLKDRQEKEALEDEIQELREKAGETAKTGKDEESGEELDKLRTEIESLRSQLASNNKRRPSSSHTTGSDSDLQSQVKNKQSTIDTLEIDISNLRHQLFEGATKSSELESRVGTLEADLESSKAENGSVTAELESLRKEKEEKGKERDEDFLSAKDEAAGEKKSEGQEKLESELNTARTQISTLEKKISTLQTLHRDSEARNTQQNSLRVKEMDRLRQESGEMRKKLQARSYENARLRSASTTSASHPDGSSEADNAADEGLKGRIRELESEVFELRSGQYAQRRQELAGEGDDAVFDDVDLNTPSVAEARARRASPYGAFSNIISTFTGQQRRPSRPQSNTQKHVGFMSSPPLSSRASVERPQGDEPGFEDDDDASFEFDEDAFRQAQEEEAKRRLERVREVKRSLPEWRGWKMDLVDLRGGGMAGVFEV